MPQLQKARRLVLDRSQELVLMQGVLGAQFLDDSEHELARPRLHPVELRVIGVLYGESVAEHSQVDQQEQLLGYQALVACNLPRWVAVVVLGD
eukprot:CAMPEP_0185615070 /NCGR_PEP_ID=MMETSP0436-20130131/34300_1 /TAXON_ID=626734 ORGANISM="Favella taraikaensis, Strain Fe Narragansett Bay" /NCGR_SAMPLE_ID=MMETSP0436 /ASSEMBLY_ACC=CAM_ASM_000390 /LENGTH=92 /DNA_ID=CAMNT_0028250443 /DNA_START=1085 /DNA_END=1363 /DNA_ORIENTATION=+